MLRRRPPDQESRRLTRCECAEVSFADIVTSAKAQGCAPEDVARRAGCGATCTACIPDLRHYLESL